MYSELLQEFVVFMLDIKLWSGRKSLRPEDLSAGGIDITSLPPGSLASLGSKRMISQDALAPFAAIKREAEKLCLAVGTRFLGGYAIPNHAVDDLRGKLDQLQLQYLQQRKALCQNYDQAVADWIDENPQQWSNIIRAAIEPVTSVRRALQFSYTPVAVSAPEGLGCNALDKQLNGLLGQLCHEIRQQAKTAYRTSYLNKIQVTRKALRPIHAIRQKLIGLFFLDPLISATIRTIDETLAAVPDQGALEGVILNQLSGLLGGQLANLGRATVEEQQCSETDDDEVAIDSINNAEVYAQGGPVVCGTSALKWDF
jgi:hypothetical protein